MPDLYDELGVDPGGGDLYDQLGVAPGGTAPRRWRPSDRTAAERRALAAGGVMDELGRPAGMTPQKRVQEQFGIDPDIERGGIWPTKTGKGGEWALPGWAVAALEGYVTPEVYARGGDVGIGDVLNTSAMIAPAASVPARTARAAAPVADDVIKPTLDDFTASGVQPSGPALSGNYLLDKTQAFAREVPLAGGAVDRRVVNAARQGLASRNRMADELGGHLDDQSFGEMLENAVTRFSRKEAGDVAGAAVLPARQTSFSTKSGALYEDVARLLPDGPDGTMVDLAATRQAVEKALRPYGQDAVDEILRNPDLARYAIEEPVSWQAARDLRGKLRRSLQKAANAAGRDVDDKVVDSVYGAMTDDISRATEAASPRAARKMKRADQFYKAGKDRINKVLKEFMSTDKKQLSATDVANKIARMAKEGASKADSRKLRAIKNSLRPEEWDEVAGTFIRKMGEPSAGYADKVPFSIEKFTTDFNKLTDTGKQVLFGPDQSQRLNSLHKAMEGYKRSERFRNRSGTANPILAAGAYGGGGMAVGMDLGTTLSLLVAARFGAEALMSPAVATWTTQAFRLAKAIKGPLESNPAWMKHVARLEALGVEKIGQRGTIRALSQAEEEEYSQ